MHSNGRLSSRFDAKLSSQSYDDETSMGLPSARHRALIGQGRDLTLKRSFSLRLIPSPSWGIFGANATIPTMPCNNGGSWLLTNFYPSSGCLTPEDVFLHL